MDSNAGLRRSRSTRRRSAHAAGRRRRDPRPAAAVTAGSRTRACRGGCPTRWSSTSSSARPRRCGRTSNRLALIDAEGVVLDRVPVDEMPDLPLLIGPAANLRGQELNQLMASVPTLKPQLVSATWVGGRRWDLQFQSGETVLLPEGRQGGEVGAGEVRRARQVDRPARPRAAALRPAPWRQDDRPPAQARSRRPTPSPSTRADGDWPTTATSR